MNTRIDNLEKILTALPKATDVELSEIVNFFEHKKTFIVPIVTRSEVSKILGVSPTRVDQLASSGKLERVFLADGKRASGFTRESVVRLTSKRIANFDEQLSALGSMVKNKINRICEFDLNEE